MSKKYDANDYSRFASIGDSDSEDEKPKSTEVKKEKKAIGICANCAKENAMLKCSRCKKKGKGLIVNCTCID